MVFWWVVSGEGRLLRLFSVGWYVGEFMFLRMLFIESFVIRVRMFWVFVVMMKMDKWWFILVCFWNCFYLGFVLVGEFYLRLLWSWFVMLREILILVFFILIKGWWCGLWMVVNMIIILENFVVDMLLN